MKTAVIGKVLVAGRVLLGPKTINCRVRTHRPRSRTVPDASNATIRFSGIWSPAPQSLTFQRVWAAETVVSPAILARIAIKS